MNLLTALALFALLFPVFPQTPNTEARMFSHPNGDYRIQLLPEWDAVVYEARTKEVVVDIIFRGQRNTALLKIEKLTLPEGETLETYLKERSETDYRLKPGFGKFRSEKFGGGKLAGMMAMMAEFDYTRTNKPMQARYYYVADGERTLWELRFSGDRFAIRGLRNETDVMARSFVPGHSQAGETK